MLKDATPQGEQHNGTWKLVPPLWHCCQRGRRCEAEKISTENGEKTWSGEISLYISIIAKGGDCWHYVNRLWGHNDIMCCHWCQYDEEKRTSITLWIDICAKVKQCVCSRWTDIWLCEPTHGSIVWLPVGSLNFRVSGWSASSLCGSTGDFVWWVCMITKNRSCCHVCLVCVKDLAWRRLFLSTSGMCEVCKRW